MQQRREYETFFFFLFCFVFLIGSEDEAKTSGEHFKENSPLQWLWESNCTHIRTHISEPVQKNIYRQCTRGYIYIYIFHLDYLQEKGSPFLRKYKYSNFSIFCRFLSSTDVDAELSCVAEPKHQFCTQTCDKTKQFYLTCTYPLDHTHRHTHYMANNHIVIKCTSKLQCSRKFEHTALVAAEKFLNKTKQKIRLAQLRT